MKLIPETEYALILRTDFSDQAAWDEICAEIRKPVSFLGFLAYVEFLDDVEYANITKDQLLELFPQNHNHSFIIVADRTSISRPEHPLLVIDLFDESAREFRAIPMQVQSIENNLSIGNMDFEELAEAVDEDGVFRGFPKPRFSQLRFSAYLSPKRKYHLYATNFSSRSLYLAGLFIAGILWIFSERSRSYYAIPKR